MNKTYVLYHDSCPDGFTSAWIAWRRLGDLVEYQPVQYGKPVPEVEPGSTVYILDFSYPKKELIALAQRANRVTVLDHHKTAQADLEGLNGTVPGLLVIFDLEKSGAVLSWNYFFPDQSVPCIAMYVQDRDLWRWELPESREFSAALGIESRTFAWWETLESQFKNESSLDRFTERGRAILAAQTAHVHRLCDSATWTEIGGYRVPCVNSSLFQSEIGEELCRRNPDAAFSAVWFSPDLSSEVWSLRSRGGFDVSVIARKFGGGGHQAAAGFKRTRV